MTYEELGQKVKAKYPDYASISDADLGKKVAAKYPEYQSQITEGSKLQTFKNVANTVNQGAKDLFIGQVKGLGSTLAGAASLGEKGLNYASEKLFPNLGIKGSDQTQGNKLQQTALAPQGIAQNIGFGAEQIGELMTPVGAGAFGSKLATMTPKFGKAGGAVLSLGKGLISGTENALKTAVQSGGDGTQTAASFGVGAAVPIASDVLKKPITKLAERIYQSALKPSEDALAQGVVKTGLKEKVWLTKGGVEKAAQKIDDLESQLDEAIKAGAAEGKTISTDGLKKFVDPIRGWFETVDVKASKEAQEYIDKTIKGFQKKYGKEIPIEEAQKLKVNTMRLIRNSYGELSNVSKETQKQMARFLKEGIVEKAPEVGDVNTRLKNLYALDDALGKASRRIGNLNLLGLGVKAGAAVGGGKAEVVAGLLADLLDKGAVKSGAAIGLNNFANLAGQGVTNAKAPVTFLLNKLIEKTRGN